MQALRPPSQAQVRVIVQHLRPRPMPLRQVVLNLHLPSLCHNHWCLVRLPHLCQKSSSGPFALALTTSHHQPERIPIQGIHQLVRTDGTPCSPRRPEQHRCYLPDSKPRCNDFQCRCQFPRSSSWTYAMIRCSHAYIYIYMTFSSFISISTLHTIFGNKSTIHHGTLSYARTDGPFFASDSVIIEDFIGFGIRADFPLKKRSRAVTY
jgi:hypothetical protein